MFCFLFSFLFCFYDRVGIERKLERDNLISYESIFLCTKKNRRHEIMSHEGQVYKMYQNVGPLRFSDEIMKVSTRGVDIL